jgi:hypothetical protein
MPSVRDTHALALEAAKDRSRGVGAEGGGGDAGLAGQRFANGGAKLASEFFGSDDGRTGEHVAARAAKAGDDDLLAVYRMEIGRAAGLTESWLSWTSDCAWPGRPEQGRRPAHKREGQTDDCGAAQKGHSNQLSLRKKRGPVYRAM